jgi:hypothetical protein
MGQYNYFHISTLPRLHNIVWCRLPEGDDLKPGTKVRPALVRGSKRDPATGRGALLVSYGTTKLDSNRHNHDDLIIQNFERLCQLDLPHAVRFDLGLENWLPWAEEFFAPPTHSIYMVAGPLNEVEKGRLRQRLKRRGIIQAL